MSIDPPFVSRGIDLIAAERQRQVAAEGWTPEHDAAHNDGALVLGAIEYARLGHRIDQYGPPSFPERHGPDWPWKVVSDVPVGDRPHRRRDRSAHESPSMTRLLDVPVLVYVRGCNCLADADICCVLACPCHAD